MEVLPDIIAETLASPPHDICQEVMKYSLSERSSPPTKALLPPSSPFHGVHKKCVQYAPHLSTSTLDFLSRFGQVFKDPAKTRDSLQGAATAVVRLAKRPAPPVPTIIIPQSDVTQQHSAELPVLTEALFGKVADMCHELTNSSETRLADVSHAMAARESSAQINNEAGDPMSEANIVKILRQMSPSVTSHFNNLCNSRTYIKFGDKTGTLIKLKTPQFSKNKLLTSRDVAHAIRLADDLLVIKFTRLNGVPQPGVAVPAIMPPPKQIPIPLLILPPPPPQETEVKTALAAAVPVKKKSHHKKKEPIVAGTANPISNQSMAPLQEPSKRRTPRKTKVSKQLPSSPPLPPPLPPSPPELVPNPNVLPVAPPLPNFNTSPGTSSQVITEETISSGSISKVPETPPPQFPVVYLTADEANMLACISSVITLSYNGEETVDGKLGCTFTFEMEPTVAARYSFFEHLCEMYKTKETVELYTRARNDLEEEMEFYL
jgi:hypothetical protein